MYDECKDKFFFGKAQKMVKKFALIMTNYKGIR